MRSTWNVPRRARVAVIAGNGFVGAFVHVLSVFVLLYELGCFSKSFSLVDVVSESQALGLT